MSAVFTAVRLSLKNVGAVRFVPLVLFDVLYPLLLCSMHFNGTEPEMIEVYLLQMSQVILPFFSVWDVIFVLREYNESEGNEVLFVNKRVSARTICAVIFCARCRTVCSRRKFCPVCRPNGWDAISAIVTALIPAITWLKHWPTKAAKTVCW